MIQTHRAQLDLGDEFIAGFIAERSDDLWEPWMRQVDSVLDDERLLEITQDAWNRLCKKSKTRGRPATPADVILRLLLLKHIRDWSSAAAQSPMINRCRDSADSWDRPSSRNCISAWSASPRRRRSFRAANCVWIPRW